MPYKDPEVRKQKAREAAARARARKDTAKSGASSRPSPQPEPTMSTASPPPSGEQTPPPSYRPRSQGKGRRSTGEVSEVALRSLHGVVDRAVVLCNIMLIDEPDRMTEDDRENIFLPLERIYLRHASAPEVSPDMADAGVSAAALFAYLMRIGAFNGLISRTRGRQPRARAPRQASASHGGNGHGMGGSAPGPGQGAGRQPNPSPVQGDGVLTPEQRLEQLWAESYVPESETA